MRDSIIQFLKQTIFLKYTLPHGEVNKSDWTNIPHDYCCTHTNDNDVAKIIYESILDYAFNEADIQRIGDLNNAQKTALISRIRYEEDDSESAKEKYGF